jgi:hypothetical protein
MGVVPLRLIEPQPLFQVWLGGGQLAAIEQARPPGVMGLQQEVRGLQALGQAEELLLQLAYRLIFAALSINHPEAPQHAEELPRLSHPLAQLACPGVKPFHLWGPTAFGRPQRRPEGHLHDQLLLAARAALWQGDEQV